jgi:hypothetical protein
MELHLKKLSDTLRLTVTHRGAFCFTCCYLSDKANLTFRFGNSRSRAPFHVVNSRIRIRIVADVIRERVSCAAKHVESLSRRARIFASENERFLDIQSVNSGVMKRGGLSAVLKTKA